MVHFIEIQNVFYWKIESFPRGQVEQFADAEHWLKYFPPLAQRDVTALGAKVAERKRGIVCVCEGGREWERASERESEIGRECEGARE